MSAWLASSVMSSTRQHINQIGLHIRQAGHQHFSSRAVRACNRERQASKTVTISERRKRLIAAGLLFGIGLGGFFDGIVFHQILQWHHMLSSEGSYPMTTVAGLETNTLWDGLFHAVTYVAVAIGLWILWRTGDGPAGRWSGTLLAGLLLMGWGIFNLVEGVINHHVLAIHHVREKTSHKTAWDLGFLVWGALMLGGGWLLARKGLRETPLSAAEPPAGHVGRQTNRDARPLTTTEYGHGRSFDQR
jgi:uncharacterized membrane protein